jgi:hypothetical protein
MSSNEQKSTFSWDLNPYASLFIPAVPTQPSNTNTQIYQCIKEGDLAAVKKAVELGCVPTQELVEYAATNGMIQIVYYFVCQWPGKQFLNIPSFFKFVCKNGLSNIVKMMITNTFFLNSHFDRNKTFDENLGMTSAFVSALEASHYNVLEEFRTRYFISNETRRAALASAFLRKNVHGLNYLLNIFRINEYGEFTKRIESLYHMYPDDSIKKLLSICGFDLEPLEEKLIRACEANDIVLVGKIIESKADVQTNDNKPLRIACNNHSMSIMQLLVNCGADIGIICDNVEKVCIARHMEGEEKKSTAALLLFSPLTKN